jgi:hypothetical protein
MISYMRPRKVAKFAAHSDVSIGKQEQRLQCTESPSDVSDEAKRFLKQYDLKELFHRLLPLAPPARCQLLPSAREGAFKLLIALRSDQTEPETESTSTRAGLVLALLLVLQDVSWVTTKHALEPARGQHHGTNSKQCCLGSSQSLQGYTKRRGSCPMTISHQIRQLLQRYLQHRS